MLCFLLQFNKIFGIINKMIKKVFHGKIHKKSADEDNSLWFFYRFNAKTKKIKPQTRSKKSKWFSLLFFVINLIVVGIVLAIQLNSEEGVGSIKELFSKERNLEFIFLAIGCFIFSEMLVAFKITKISKKYNKKASYLTSLKSEFVCQYYNKVTPFAVGGQPFQVYELSKHGMRANNAVTVVSCNYISSKFVYWFISLFMMLTIGTNMLVKNMSGTSFYIVLILATFSLSFMTIYLTFIILICINKRLANKLVGIGLNLLYKMKIVKDKSKLYFKIMRPALSFQHKMKAFFKAKKFASFSMIISLFFHLIQYCIPACIYFIFEPFSWSVFWQLLSIAVVIQLSFGVIPMPGGSGVAEFSFYTVFKMLIQNDLVFWALLLWRILTYYIYLLIGIVILIYDYAYGNRKLRKRRQKLKINT